MHPSGVVHSIALVIGQYPSSLQSVAAPWRGDVVCDAPATRTGSFICQLAVSEVVNWHLPRVPLDSNR